MIHSW